MLRLLPFNTLCIAGLMISTMFGLHLPVAMIPVTTFSESRDSRAGE